MDGRPGPTHFMHQRSNGTPYIRSIASRVASNSHQQRFLRDIRTEDPNLLFRVRVTRHQVIKLSTVWHLLPPLVPMEFHDGRAAIALLYAERLPWLGTVFSSNTST